MNEEIYDKMIGIIERVFNISSVSLSEYSTFGDFQPLETDWWELEEEVEECFGVKVDSDIFCEPIFDVVVYIDYLIYLENNP